MRNQLLNFVANIERGLSMTEKLRNQLNVIQEMLKEEDGDNLWDILSALRGPDNDDPKWSIKKQTTSYIRAAAFPDLLVEGINGTSMRIDRSTGWTAEKGTISRRFCHSTTSSHFSQHIQAAANILEILNNDN